MDKLSTKLMAERVLKNYSGHDPLVEALARGIMELFDENERLTDKLADEILDNEERQSISEITREHYNPITDGALTDENDEPIV